MSPAGRSLITIDDLGDEELHAVLDTAGQMAEALGLDDAEARQMPDPLDRILATCFFEPSTRTRLSFESAMLRLGGSVVGFADRTVSSTEKGETVADTARVVSGYADIIAIRHPRAGAAKVAADATAVPVINAGDGPHAHPTQTLTDLFCIQRNKGRLDGLKVGLLGDLKYGRTVHSLGPVMTRLGSECICIAPQELAMPEEYVQEMARLGGGPPRQVTDLAEVLQELDVLYVTRVQKERFANPADYERLAGAYVVDAQVMARAPEHMILLHPLPRVDEIHPEVDADERARYFEQAAGGVPVRMALISHLLGLVETRGHGKMGFDATSETVVESGGGGPQAEPEIVPASAVGRCRNPNCITNDEKERFLEGAFYQLPGDPPRYKCIYCEQLLET